MRMTRQTLKILPEVIILIVNAFVGLSFYVVEQMLSHSRYLKVNYTFLAEKGFAVGVVALLAVLILRWKLKSPLLRMQLLIALTLYNQACLLAFVVSVTPHIL